MINAVQISNEVAEVYHSTFTSKMLHQITTGGRASTKSSKNALKIIMSMLENPDEEWIVVREDYAHHADSTYLELQTACERLGLKEGRDFFSRGTKLKITLYTGSTIRFGSMNNFRKLKGFAPTTNKKYIGGIWFFEIDEFKSSYGMSQTVATFIRGKKPHFICLYEYNPPELGSWVYAWVKEMKERSDTIFISANYTDLTEWERQNWLGQLMLDEIEETKKINLNLYENIYLGIPRILEGACFPVQMKEFNISDFEGRFNYISVGIDYGDNDATTAVATAELDGVFYIIGQYYDKSPNKLITEKEEEIRNFLNALRDEYQTEIDVYCDTNPQTLYIMLKQDIYLLDGIYIKKVNKAKIYTKSKSAIQERIDATNILIGKGEIYLSQDLEQVRTALLEARYDRNGNRLDDGTSDIDTLDALEYSLKPEIKYILQNYYKG